MAPKSLPKNPRKTHPVFEAIALTEQQSAAYLSISCQFLRLSRHYGNRPGHAAGPPFIRLGGGRAIRYLKSDLDAWLQEYRQHPTPLPQED